MNLLKEWIRNIWTIWNRFWFQPASASQLGAARVVFYSALFVQFSKPDFVLWTRLFPEFWRPIWFLALFNATPPSAAFVTQLTFLWRISLLFSAVGLFTRAATVSSALLGAYLMGVKLSAGYLSHIDNLNLLCLFIFALSSCGTYASVDAAIQTKREVTDPEKSGAYLWPIKLIWLSWMMSFFLAALTKLRFSGIDWVTDGPLAESLKQNAFFYSENTLNTWRSGLGIWLSNHPAICSIASGLTLLLELLTPLIFFGLRTRFFIVIACALFQFGIYAVMGVNFSHYLPVYLLFIDWSRLLSSIRSSKFLKWRDRTPAFRSTLFVLLVCGCIALGLLAKSIFFSSPEDKRPINGPSLTTRVLEICHPPIHKLLWPVAGEAGKDWVINAEVDTGEQASPQDEESRRGVNALTISGHRGIDIDVPGFVAMDVGIAVRAVEDGVVEFANDGEWDRNILKGENCENALPFGNSVVLKGNSGFRYTYAHLRLGSVNRSVGTHVLKGEQLGQIGSSGCSSQPHLHFEAHDCLNEMATPIKEHLFETDPTSRFALRIFQISTKIGSYDRLSELIGAVGQLKTASRGNRIAAVIGTAGGKISETLSIMLRSPDNQNVGEQTWTISGELGHRYWYWNAQVGKSPGIWKIIISINGAEKRVLQISVN